MRSMKKIIIFGLSILMLLCLFGCSRTNEGNNENNEKPEKNQNIPEDTEENNNIQDDSVVLPIWAESKEVIKIRAGYSTSYNRVGYVRPGDVFVVYEQIENEGYLWNRIGIDEWIADDGSWLNYDIAATKTKINLFSLSKLPESLEINYVNYSKDITNMTWHVELTKDSTGNIIGFNEIWYYGSENSSSHPGDDYRFGTIQHLYYGKNTTHDYDTKGNVVKETYISPYGVAFIKDYLFDDSGKLSKIINYQDGYPSLDHAIISTFEYDNNDITENMHLQGSDILTYYHYMLNGNIVFQYSKDMDVNNEKDIDDLHLVSFYRFDSEGDIAEEFNLGGDRCYMDFIYNY